MDMTALLLSRIQFAFTIGFHIIFPSFTIGLAAWLVVLEGLDLVTRRPVYRRLFDFWLKIFGVAFGLGVVSGIVMAFQFGTNWSRLSGATGPIQGPLLAYESFTAFALEAAFFGVLIFGRPRVPPIAYFLATLMVALGTTFSAFWIMVNNSWMQAPVGYVLRHGVFVPTDWAAIIFSPVVWVRFPHMLIAAYLTGAFCVAATGAWYRLRRTYAAEAGVMLRMGLFLAARAGSGAAALRAPQRRLCTRAPTREVRRDRGPLARRAARGRGADRSAGWQGRDQSTATRDPLSGQPGRRHEPRFQGSRADRFCQGRPAARSDPVLRVPGDGGLRAADAGDRLAGFAVGNPGAVGATSLAALGRVSELPAALRRHADRLVHR